MIGALTPEQRTSLYYFSQFMSGGAMNAFGGIWLKEQGLTTTEIGMITTVPIAILLLTNIFVGRLADRASDWRQVIMVGALAAGAFSCGLFFAQGFLPILLFFTLTVICQSLIVPVTDAAAMHLSNERGANFGTIRGFASVGYMVLLVITGFLAMYSGPVVFIPLFVGLSMLRGAASLILPRFKAEHAAPAPKHTHHFSHFFEPWFILPLLGWCIVFGTHMVLNGFQSLLWSEQGLSGGLIGVLIAIGAASESLMFFMAHKLGKNMDLRLMIIFSGVVTVLRWFAMSYSPPLYFVVPLQMLHGITFALGYLACINFIARNKGVEIAAEAQSFFVVVQQISSVVVITIFSKLAEHFGSGAYLGNAAMAAVGTLIILVSYGFKSSPKPAL